MHARRMCLSLERMREMLIKIVHAEAFSTPPDDRMHYVGSQGILSDDEEHAGRWIHKGEMKKYRVFARDLENKDVGA